MGKARKSFENAIKLAADQRIKADAIEADAIEADAIEADALIKKSLTFHEQKEKKDSLDALKDAVKIDENTALNTLNNEALNYYDDKNYEKALKAFDEAIDLYPKNYQAWYWKGLIYHYQNRHTKAREAFEKAIEI